MFVVRVLLVRMFMFMFMVMVMVMMSVSVNIVVFVGYPGNLHDCEDRIVNIFQCQCRVFRFIKRSAKACQVAE